MADKDPTRDAKPDPDESPYLRLVHCRDWCQHQLARMTMPMADFEVYAELTRNFRAHDMPYENFRFQMSELLLLKNPNYAHLQVYWEVFHREVIGERRSVDNPLFLVPVTLFYLLNGMLIYIIDLAQPGDSVRHQDFLQGLARQDLINEARVARSSARRIEWVIEQFNREARIRADLLEIMGIQEHQYREQDPK